MPFDIANILTRGVEMKCSDIHITVGLPPMGRIDSQIIAMEGYDIVTPSDTESIALMMMGEHQTKQFNEHGEVDFSYSMPGLARYRMNIFKQRNSISIVARVLATRIPTIDEMGLPTVLKELALKPRGLILVTGPTGSGKSTTLAAMIDYINKNRHGHILTLEDPIEYLHRHGNCIVNQREVGGDTRSFAAALRAALREDPDVILVGEMRDLETITTAISAAETGHLVLSTLHTISADQTVDRIIDVFPSGQQQQIKVQLAGVLQGIISQQLLRLMGTKGRAAAMEILLMNDAIRNTIREGKTHQIASIMQTSFDSGMTTMDYSLAKLVKDRKISRHDAENYCVDIEMFNRYLQQR
ncbi:MAG: type IV pilus twitching motility protein PilT [Oscillospiraceae bacterium]|nr:type IV pilus twitching motility protein PilT [Oscillospiraceae bacterium]